MNAKTIGSLFRKPEGFLGKLLGRMMNYQHNKLTDYVLDELELQIDDYVLDIGCGGGMALKKVSRICREGFAAGIDHSPAMVAMARRINRKNLKKDNMDILQASVEKLPYEDTHFNKIIAVESFYFWPEHAANLKECFRVLKTGGKIAFGMEVHKDGPRAGKHKAVSEKMEFPIFSGKEIGEYLSAAGFSDIQFKVIPHFSDSYLLVRALKA